jgi:hypothetical protein
MEISVFPEGAPRSLPPTAKTGEERINNPTITDTNRFITTSNIKNFDRCFKKSVNNDKSIV